MAQRSPLRLAAPLALVAFVVVLVIVLASSRVSDGGSASTSSGSTGLSPSRSADTSATQRSRAERKTYVVKAGDLLSGISQETGVPVPRLQELNPGIDPQALRVGQRLKLTE